MLLCQRPFGVLTTYEETWFFTRIPPLLLRDVLRGGVPDINDYRDDGHVFISPAIFSESSEPTVLQAFAYFLQLAICLKDVRLCDDSEAGRLGKGEETEASSESAGDLVKHDRKAADQDKNSGRGPPSRRFLQSMQNRRQVRGKQKRQGPEERDSQQKSALPEYSLTDFQLGRLVTSGNGRTAFLGVWGGCPVMVKILDSYKYEASELLLRHEEAVYKHLINAQGQAIPHLVCSGQIGGGMLCVLATSYEGTSLASTARTPKIRVAACQSLSKLHAAGVVHGDIHMGNIVVKDADTSYPSVKFVEFGLASIMRQSPTQYSIMKEEEIQLRMLFY